MNKSEILIYQAADGKIKIDVQLQDDTVWLTQAHIAELFGKGRSTITEHIQNIFREGELEESVVCRKFRHTTQHGAIQDKTQTKEVKYYNLDVIIQLNGREILTHAGKISHQMAIEKSALEYDKFREAQKQLQHEESLRELEQDIQQLKATEQSD